MTSKVVPHPPMKKRAAATSVQSNRTIGQACHQRGFSTRETDTNYFGIVVPQDRACRVIVCGTGLQYIIQRCYQCVRGDEWRALGYLTSRDSLIAFHERSEWLSEASKAHLLALPMRPEWAWQHIANALMRGAELPPTFHVTHV